MKNSIHLTFISLLNSWICLGHIKPTALLNLELLVLLGLFSSFMNFHINTFYSLPQTFKKESTATHHATRPHSRRQNTFPNLPLLSWSQEWHSVGFSPGPPLNLGENKISFSGASPFLISCPFWRPKTLHESSCCYHTFLKTNKEWAIYSFVYSFTKYLEIIYYECGHRMLG